MNPSDIAEPFKGPGRREAKDIASVMRGYDALMSKVYDFLTCWFMAPLIRESHQTLLGHMNQAGATKLLDIGCGTGILMDMAGRRTPWDLMVGLDISTGMLERAKRKLARAGLMDRSEIDYSRGDQGLKVAIDFPTGIESHPTRRRQGNLTDAGSGLQYKMRAQIVSCALPARGGPWLNVKPSLREGREKRRGSARRLPSYSY